MKARYFRHLDGEVGSVVHFNYYGPGFHHMSMAPGFTSFRPDGTMEILPAASPESITHEFLGIPSLKIEAEEHDA